MPPLTQKNRRLVLETPLGEDVLLFCGLAIGYRDESDSVNGFVRERVPLDEQVTFLGF